MGGAMTGMTNHAKKGDTDEFCSSVQSFSSSVCGLTEAAVQVRFFFFNLSSPKQYIINPLLDEKILDRSKLKQIAGDILKSFQKEK